MTESLDFVNEITKLKAHEDIINILVNRNLKFNL